MKANQSLELCKLCDRHMANFVFIKEWKAYLCIGCVKDLTIEQLSFKSSLKEIKSIYKQLATVL